MKRIILTIIILSLLFGTISLAQNTELPSPGITPDSLFYFLDTLAEKIGMFFTFGAEKKAEKAIKYAEEKLAEVKAMAERNKVKALEKASQKYQEYLGLANERVQEAKEKGKDVEELAILITEKTLKHQEILVEVFGKIPEEAKEGIQKAIEVSRRGSEEAVQAVTGAKKEELQQKIEEALIIPVNWKAYRNEKYGYSFKYPPDCFYGPMPVYCKEKPPEERPPECLCFLNSEDPDRVFLQAFTGEKDSLTLADFSVSHYETSWYNPPPDTDLIKWLKEKFSDLHEDIPDQPNMEIDGIPAVKIYTPSSPMAFSGEGIYFIRNDMLFMVSMLDVDSESNKELYNQILSTFKFIELEEAREEAPEVEEKPYIKVISPNGGEEWKVGNTYNIIWASEGVEKVNIFLLGCKTKECPVESGISSYKIYPHSLDAEAGKYSWTIYSKDIGFGFGFGISEYVCFKIKIEEASSESVGILDKFLSMLAYISNKLGVQTPDLVEDVSDECFMIEEKPTVPNTPVMRDIDVSTTAGVPYKIGWTNVSEATSYILERDTNSSFSNPVTVYSGQLNSFGGTLSPSVSTTYYFRVKACNKYGCSSWSKITELWVEVCPLPETPVLTDPGISVKNEVFTVKWTSVSGVTKYQVQRDTNPNFSAPLSIPDYWLDYELNSMTGNPHPEVTTTYYYRIKACNDCGCSSWSNIVDMRVVVDILAKCYGITDNAQKISCYAQVAVANNQPTICNQVPIINGPDWCYLEVIKSIVDETICQNVKAASNRDNCYNNVAKTKQDETICELAGGLRDTCYIELAKVKKDPNLCEKVAFVWQEGFLDLKGSCYFELAKIKNDINLCDKISYQGMRNNCYTFFPSITVISPNGGEEWVIGKTYDIKWNSTGLDKVTIDLFAYNSEGQVIKGFQYFIANSIDAAKGYYTWTIPEIEDYPNYKLRIYNKLCIGGDRDLLAECLKDQYFDESDNYFSIVSPFVTVTSPNGGEVWAEGVTHHIKWDSAGVDSVQIRCLVEYGDGNSEKFSVVQLAKNLGYYDWTIPDLSTKFEYKYKIWVGDPDGLVSDWSDDYFQIGPSPPPEP